MRQHLKDLYNSLNQSFPNDQCMIKKKKLSQTIDLQKSNYHSLHYFLWLENIVVFFKMHTMPLYTLYERMRVKKDK